MIRFTKTVKRADDSYDTVEVSTSEHASLSELIEQFENFLRASGYSFDGYLEMVEEDDDNAGVGG